MSDDPRVMKLATLFAPMHLLEHLVTPQNKAKHLINTVESVGLRVIDPESAVDIIAQHYDFYEWDLAHKILQDETGKDEYRVGWATLTLSKARLRAKKLLDTLQKSAP